jgi:excinuclease ABC subunit C
VNQQQYSQMISDLQEFLNGHSEPIMARVQQDMEKAAEETHFEKAAALRDRLKAMQSIVERQKVVFAADYKDSDVIAMARADNEACVQIFFIRGGKLIGREYFVLEGTEDTADKEVMAEFVKQFYTEAAEIPQQVFLPQEIEEAQIIGQWLRSRRGGEKTEMVVPRSGQPHDLVQMAAENAAETLQALRTQWQADAHKQEQALAELQSALQLPNPPNRIECYDISHTQGVATVGSMVVFSQGVPDKRLYRRFNVEGTVGLPDDFASMEEVLRRRFKRWQASRESDPALVPASAPGAKAEPSFSFLPDLLIVDGGKGQLSRAVEVLRAFELEGKIPVVGLAKQEEEIFFPGKLDSLLLPRHSQGLYLIQRIRDEAHRFAVSAHRARRSKQGMASALDSLPGIGPVKRKALLKYFGSVDKIREASVVELGAVPGINPSLAESIKANLE